MSKLERVRAVLDLHTKCGGHGPTLSYDEAREFKEKYGVPHRRPNPAGCCRCALDAIRVIVK